MLKSFFWKFFLSFPEFPLITYSLANLRILISQRSCNFFSVKLWKNYIRIRKSKILGQDLNIIFSNSTLTLVISSPVQNKQKQSSLFGEDDVLQNSANSINRGWKDCELQATYLQYRCIYSTYLFCQNDALSL